MCTNPITLRIPATLSDRLQGYSSDSVVTIPCGRCCECMKRKQNSIRFRVYNEAKKRGTMDFVTLTYNDDSLPIAQSFWIIDKDSGEMSLLSPCSVVDRSELPASVKRSILGDLDSVRKHKVRYVSLRHPFSDIDSQSDYYTFYTPCHDYSEVKKLLKLIRKWYFLKYNEYADFSYLICPELGEHYSRRPHFHCCFFGCPSDFIGDFSLAWSDGLYRPNAQTKRFLLSNNIKPRHWYFGSQVSFLKDRYKDDVFFTEVFSPKGFVNSQRVNAVNSDGSDGFAKCASYVGKYVGKGVFEDAVIKDHFLELPRVSISCGFGKLPQDLIDWHLCKDIYGDYDDVTLNGLCKTDIDKIVESVSNRLFHSFQGKNYAFPIQFKNQLFRRGIAKSRTDVPSYIPKEVSYSYSEWPASGKAFYSALFYKVQAFIHDRTLQKLTDEFNSFISHHKSISLCQAVALFEHGREHALKVREEIAWRTKKHSLSTLKI